MAFRQIDFSIYRDKIRSGQATIDELRTYLEMKPSLDRKELDFYTGWGLGFISSSIRDGKLKVLPNGEISKEALTRFIKENEFSFSAKEVIKGLEKRKLILQNHG